MDNLQEQSMNGQSEDMEPTSKNRTDHATNLSQGHLKTRDFLEDGREHATDKGNTRFD